MRMKLFEPPPSTMYAARVNGAPAKPMTGTESCSAARVRRIASATKPVVSTGSGHHELLDVRRGPQRRGEVRPAVAELELHPHRLGGDEDVGEDDRRVHAEPATGWTVTSAARSGVLQSGRKSIFSRMARYSGRYRPA